MTEKKLVPSNVVSSLVRNARRGDIRAIYQMHLNYLKGNYIEADSALSKHYLNNVVNIIKNKKISVVDLSLQNFRGIGELTVKFNEQLTVFIGNNGFGKTTVLDALASTLSWLKSNILREDRPGQSIRDQDINNNENAKYASITSRFSLDKKYFNIMLSRPKPGSTEKRNNELQDIKSLAGIYRYTSEFSEEIHLPLVAYYPVSRSNEGSGIDLKKNNVKNKNSWDKFDAYDDVLTDRHDFAEFFSWFAFINNIAQQKKGDSLENEILLIESEISGSLVTLDTIEKLPGIDKKFLEPVKKEIETKKKKINELKKIQVSQNIEAHIISTIIKAFEMFLPDLKNIRIFYSKNDIKLLMTKNGVDIDAQQLSQGEKSLLTLIGDITRRLVILNSSRENPLLGEGIVLIDEIDLHLHPIWQQTIVGNLIKVFPKIQFVISTHSPQVLSTISAECIRILFGEYNDQTNNFDIKSRSPEFQTKGVRSTELLSEIMFTDPLPPIEEADWIDEYKGMIETDSLDTENAQTLWEKILKHYGKNHPVVIECAGLVSIQKIKMKLAQKRLRKES